MTNELATTTPATTPLVDQQVTYKTLQTLITTPTVPSRYRESATGVNDMMAVVMAGKEVGVQPMEALNSIYLVNGQASMSGKLMTALVRRAGHKIRLEVSTDSVTATAFRRDYVTHELEEEGSWTFTQEDAERADLTGKDTYKKYPQSMLAWRAISNLCKFYFSDVVTGMLAYVPEELNVDAPMEAIELDDDMEIVGGEVEIEELRIEGAVADVVEVLDGEVVR